LDRERPRRQAGFNSRQLRTPDPIGGRPDRVAFWAVVLAIVVLVVAAGTGSARAGGSGGVAPEGTWTEGVATYYGPGIFGADTACGQKLTRTLLGVAHKTLPCGTKVTFRYQGNSVRTTVVDRGPYGKGRTWDLTYAAAKDLDMLEVGVDTVKAKIAD